MYKVIIIDRHYFSNCRFPFFLYFSVYLQFTYVYSTNLIREMVNTRLQLKTFPELFLKTSNWLEISISDSLFLYFHRGAIAKRFFNGKGVLTSNYNILMYI